jgi:hypothetical protein
MYDNIAAWMIAGGIRSELPDRRQARHRIEIQEARRAARAGRPGILDRVRLRFAARNDSATLDCCGA